MRVLIAPDSFKGTLSATEICQILTTELGSKFEIITHPLADGGEGSLEAIAACLPHYQWITLTVTGPLPNQTVTAKYLWLTASQTAFIEMAQASGLTLLQPADYNPELTTTYGTGELIHHAIQQGAKQIYLVIGGSATNDAGLGCLMALGWQFFDGAGQRIGYGGQGLSKLARWLPPPGLVLPPVTVLCDVTNPLYGVNGAAYVYAPQKGADASMVKRLDQGLRHFAQVVQDQENLDLNFSGAGAAGGLGAGAKWGLKANLERGFTAIAQLTQFSEKIQNCDYVITGEGQLDEQSLQGKVIAGVWELAQKYHKPLILLCGSAVITPSLPDLSIITLVSPDFSLADCLSNPQRVLGDRCQAIKQILLNKREISE
ncbi:MAG: glycerate kinase [Microcystaceae cyanobacterium]